LTRTGGGLRHLVPTLTAGGLVGLLEVVAATSFAALIFAGPLATRIGEGVGLFVAAGALILLVVALLSGRSGVVAGTQDSTAAILALVAGGIAAEVGGGGDTAFLSVVAAITLSAVLSGAVLFLLGTLRLGGLVRFIPYPVVGGFLAGTGWLLVKGSTEVMTGIVPTFDTVRSLFGPEALAKLLPGIALGVLLVVVPRLVRGTLTIPALLFAGTVVFYVGLLVSGTSIDDAKASGWLLGPFPDVDLWQPWVGRALGGADWSAIAGQAGAIATLILVAALALLLNASGIELALRRDVRFDRELRTAGVASAAAGLVGGIPGFHVLGTTKLTRRLGADARWAGIIAAVICLAALALGASVMSLFPRIVLGALLLFLGLEFIVEWLWDTRHAIPKGEYAIVLAIVIAVAVWGILVGVAIGLVLAIVLFAVSYSRTDLVRHAVTASTFRSNVERGPDERRVLHELGDQIQILKLQGFVFFGTANSLFDRIRARAQDPALPKLSFLVLDFRRVTGLDSSAVLSFVKVAQLAQTTGFQVVYTAVPIPIRAQLEVGGVREGEAPIAFAPDLDRGVQHCEDLLLEQAFAREDGHHLPLLEELFGGDGIDPDRLAPYLDALEVPAGTPLMRQGERPDALYLLEAGRLTVQLETAGGDVVRIRTLGRGTIVGEIAMYLGTPRTATVVADGPCHLLRLTREALERMEREEPELAAGLHKGFARVMAERLTDTLTLVETLID
jgi:SulP family sulfate permease